jgi:hypothetical protein
MKTKIFHDCQVERRVLTKHGTLNLTTGAPTYHGREWTFRPCSVPLFDEQERATGICRNCRIGWTHPHNYPTGKGLVLLTRVLGSTPAEPWTPGTIIALDGEEHQVIRYRHNGLYVVLLRALGWEILRSRDYVAENLANEAVVLFKADDVTAEMEIPFP